jgi:phosphoenolpyruvate synthase/pyruvate phosphate dikinase
MNQIKTFNQISKADTEIAGGKGASLGEMTQAGIPVPEGFVILSNFFDKFLEETDLNIKIDAILDTIDTKRVHTVENASEKIQAMILSKEMPEDIKTEILKFYRNLNSKFVAVRSSATSEDSASATWAGQLDSFLNTTNETILENVKKCWASLFTPRAIFYRFEKKLNKDKISVAVVVQKMVDSEESGIAFSVHPVTQDENQIIIEAGFGLGEAIVSGSITPDSYVVDKKRFSILDINVNEQTKSLCKKTKGGNEWKELGEKGKKQVLTEKEIVELSKLIMKIETHYGFSCDVEWAKEKGKFYITQSRPITTINSLEKKENIVDSFLKTLNGKKIFQCMDTNIFPETVVWAKRNFLKENYEDKTPLPFIILMKDKQSVAYYQEEIWDKIGEEFTRKYLLKDPSAKTIIDIFNKDIEKMNKLYSKYSYDYISKKSLSELQKIMPELMKIMEPKFFSETDKKFCKKYLSDLSNKEIDEVWRKGFEPACESFDLRQKRLMYEKIIEGKNHKELKEDFQYFYTGLTTVLDLNETEKKLKEEYNIDKNKAQKELAKIKKILTYKEFKEWHEKLSERQKEIVDFLQNMIRYRDLRKDVHTKGITIFYRIALLKIFNKLKIPKQFIQFISYDELLKPLSYFKKNKEKIISREKGYALFTKNRGETESDFIDFIKEKNKLDAYMDKDSNKNSVYGMSASKGIIRGKVRIIKSIQTQGKDFKEGEVLVTGMTRPEYVTIAKKSSAIVTDEGGITCHAAIISRELNKPCIVGTENGTRILKTGDYVEVNANTGIVRIIKNSE